MNRPPRSHDSRHHGTLGSMTIRIERLESRSMLAADARINFTVAPPPAANTLHAIVLSSSPAGPVGGATSTVTVPGAPTGVAATAGDSRVTLTWTPPTSTGGATRLAYTVQYSSDSGTTWTTVNQRFAEPKATICNLTNGQAYVFRVAAVNRAGTGAYSGQTTAVTPIAPVITLPGAPTGVTATAGDGTVRLAWTAPADAGGAKRLGYVVQFSSDGGTTWSNATQRFDDTRAVVSFLTNGTPYVFRVAALNKAGQGAFSTPSAAVTPIATTLPGAPTNVQAVAGSGRVTLNWTAPANTGGAQRLGYVVQMSTDGGKTWTSVNRRFDQTTAVIPFLSNGVAYTFRVAAFNKAGQGAFSGPSAAVTPIASSGTATTGRRPKI